MIYCLQLQSKQTELKYEATNNYFLFNVIRQIVLENIIYSFWYYIYVSMEPNTYFLINVDFRIKFLS